MPINHVDEIAYEPAAPPFKGEVFCKPLII